MAKSPTELARTVSANLPETAVQVIANGDPVTAANIMAGLATKQVDEAQLAVVVYEFRQELTKTIEIETAELESLDAERTEKQKELVALVVAIDGNDHLLALDAACKALVAAGYKANNPTASEPQFHAATSQVSIKLNFDLAGGNYGTATRVYWDAPEAILVAYAAVEQAETTYKAQHAAVGGLRRDLANTPKIEETVRHNINKKLLASAGNANERMTEVDELVSSFVAKSRDGVAREKAKGKAQLTSKK